MTDPAGEVRLVILAGGEGRRMGGDKLRLRDAAGRLLVRQWFDRLDWPAPPLLVRPAVAAGASDAGVPDELAGWPVVHDAAAGDGPLRGVEAALATDVGAWFVVVAVDTPGVGREQVDWLLARRDGDASARLWMPRHAGRIEPVPMLVHGSMRAAVVARLATGRRSLHGLADEPEARVVDAPAWPAGAWINLNRPEDLAAHRVPPPGLPGEG